MAKVRITIGGIEASKKNLNALQTAAEQMSEKIKSLNAQKVKLVDANDVKGADAVVKEMNKLNASLKATREMIRLQESELNNYTNILDNLAGTPLINLQKGLRDLQAQMKQTLTLGDVERYAKLKAAYDQLMSSVDQLSGKMPNLTYVMKNLGQVADKTLADSIAYSEKLIASTDKTTKRGRDNIKAWSADLKAMRTEMSERSIKVLDNPQAYSVEQIQQSIANLKKLQPVLKLSGQAWDDYAQKIKQGEEYLKSYDEKQKQIAEKEMRRKTNEVLANPAGFSQGEVEEAIRNAEKLQKAYKTGSPWWIHYKEGVDKAKESLDAYNKKQKEAEEANRKLQTLSVLNDPFNSKLTQQQLEDAIKHGKELQKLLPFMGDEWVAYASKIKVAEERLNVFKDTSVDVAAILKDPKNFSTEEIQKAIKQLEETGLKIEVKDTDAIQQNIADIEKLKTVLADSAHSQTFVDQVIKDASEGKVSVEDLEKAIAATKEKLRHTKDATMAEKLKQDLDQLNPKLELTKTSLARVSATLGNIKGANLGSLKEAAERLKVELNDVNLKMDDFAEKAAQLKKVNAQIKELEAQTKNVASAWDNAVSRLQNWVLIYAGSSEIWNKMVQAYQGTLKLSDAMTDVRKTTGLTADEVERLTDEVQELDTRITNEKLMEAATEAGRIGLKTRQEVLEFTRASAITLTALDELDARSITSVMKLNSLLGETARLGVQQAILSTASSINELSMASSAAQQPIIDFSRRFGGIAAQANISTAEVLGLGATIDALGQPIEMSSTALNKFTTALLSNGKQIAEDTGLSEEYVFEMTRQGKTIELMIEVLGKLNNMGGIGEISKYMGDMGGDGARMTAVVSALAANLGFLREQIDLSKMSFEEGISVINEYNLKNENAAALVARMGNEIKEVFVDSSMVSAVTAVLRVLQQLVHFMLSGTAAAKAFNAVLILIVTRMFMLNKTIRGWNDSLRLHIMYAREGTRAWISWSGALNLAKAGIVGLGKAIKGLFVSNPLGLLISISYIVVELFRSLKGVEEQTEKTRSAIDRANEAFEEESYKLNKLRDALDEVKKEQEKANGSAKTYAEIISTLNRDYGKHLGFVLDMAAGYDELRNAIDLATEASRLNILQNEKNRNFQIVQEDFRERNNQASNTLKEQIGIGSSWSGQFEGFAEDIQKDLYAAIVSDLGKSAAIDGMATIGEKTDAVIRRMAEVRAESLGKTVEDLVADYTNRLNRMSAVTELANIYTQKQAELTEMDKEVDIQVDTQKAVVLNSVKKQVELTEARNDLSNKQARDYTAEDESTLQSIISQYEYQKKLIDKNLNKDEWEAVEEELKFFKARQREVMLAFVENPLRGIKMKVGEDGKLYKDLSEAGKVQYESVEKLEDANKKMLVDAYKRSETIYQQLLSDYQHNMDSQVRDQAKKLSDWKTAIKKFFAQNGEDIDQYGNLTLRDTEYRDGSERESEKEAKAAYKALLDNMEEYYGKRKEIILARLLAEGKTIKEKNLEMKKWEVEYRQGLVDMQSELLGKGESFEESVFIRDIENYQKAAELIRNASKTFQDKVANDMQKNRNKILELQFLPAAGKGGGDAEKGIRKAYTAILKNIEEYYAKQKQLVEADYLNSTITVEEKNRRLEELNLQHWQAQISMQREVLGEGDFFNENLYIRDLENFQYVVKHMLDETHHYQDTVRTDMENTIYEQEALLSKHKRKVDEILLGNDYQAQVNKEMQEALEVAGLFWGEAQDRTEKNAKKITAAIKEASKDSYAMDAQSFRDRLEANEVFGETVKAMSEEQFAAYLILLQQFHDKTIEADKKFADQRRKITQQMWESGGYENQYNYANNNIKNRQENVTRDKDFGAMSDREAFEEQHKLALEQWALEEWRFQMQYELAVKAGETEEQLLERRMEMAEMEKEMQRQVTEAYLEEYNRRADKISQHAQKFGEFAGVMASAAWNSVEDRKKAGEELLKYIAQETTEYIRELLVRKIKEEVLRRQGLKEAKKGEEDKQDIEQKGVEESTKIAEIGGKIKTGIEEKITGEISSIAESGAVQSATTAVKKASVDSAAGMASGAAKTIGELGWWGIPLIAAIEGVISMLLNMAMSALSSSFGSSTSTAKTNKRLATGMLTYASGRYPVEGDDGVTYDAQYEPRLQTKIYQGGKGKAHMALFSEVMPEMVISGPTTKIIQEDFPALMNAILTIDKYGTLPQPRRMRRYETGNLDEFDVDMQQGTDGTYTESPAIAELRQSNAELRDTVARLATILENGIHANINMYGTGGIKESMDKANKFYTKNRIK